MSWTGIVFVLWLAPNARYAMGYIMLPVSIGIAAWLTKARPESVAVHLTQSGRFRFVAYGLGAIAVALVLLGATGDDFLVPRRMARTDGDPIRIVNRQARTSATFSVSQDAGVPFRVLRPFASDQCWDAELPCTPRLTVTGIRLRDESRGYSQGFVRSLGSRDGEIAMVRPVPGTSASPEGR